MLILTRKPGQALQIILNPTLRAKTVDEVFRRCAFELRVLKLDRGQVRLGLHAHSGLLIVRAELAADKLQSIMQRRAVESEP